MREAERQELLGISGRDDEGKSYIGSSQESDSDTNSQEMTVLRNR